MLVAVRTLSRIAVTGTTLRHARTRLACVAPSWQDRPAPDHATAIACPKASVTVTTSWVSCVGCYRWRSSAVLSMMPWTHGS